VTKDRSGELTKHILAAAKDRGFDVSENQLKRWHRDGLLPQPRQSWTSGVEGSEAIYPVGTSDQLCALCAVQVENRSSAANWGWKLWWLGFPVHRKFWLRRLLAQAAIVDETSMELTRLLDSDQPNDNYQDIITNLRTRRTPNMPFLQLRRRTGIRHFESAIGLIRDILMGDFLGWSYASKDDPDSLRYQKMIQRVLGLRRANNIRNMMTKPSMPDAVEPALRFLSKQLGETKIANVLTACSVKNITQTRTQLRVLLFMASGSNGQPNELTDLGIDVLKVMASRTTPADQATLLLYMLALNRNPEFRKELAKLLLALRRFVPEEISQSQIEDFRRKDPDICSFAFPD